MPSIRSPRRARSPSLSKGISTSRPSPNERTSGPSRTSCKTQRSPVCSTTTTPSKPTLRNSPASRTSRGTTTPTLRKKKTTSWRLPQKGSRCSWRKWPFTCSRGTTRSRRRTWRTRRASTWRRLSSNCPAAAPVSAPATSPTSAPATSCRPSCGPRPSACRQRRRACLWCSSVRAPASRRCAPCCAKEPPARALSPRTSPGPASTSAARHTSTSFTGKNSRPTPGRCSSASRSPSPGNKPTRSTSKT
mmetsp:Transcript_12644/g.38144  ORF Transcript_12644/g.38144 Transcript_12644/m.38144 type:complete len:247 (+) Transcript_12644:308-1048(+)